MLTCAFAMASCCLSLCRCRLGLLSIMRQIQVVSDSNFLLVRPYHGEHGPQVPVTSEYIVLQRVLRKRECMSILTKNSNKHASYVNGWLIKGT
jgi:hypothetical protein